jgi:S1-C subfamily serine protease
MRKILLIIIFGIIFNFCSGQDVSIFNGYRYIYLPPLEYNSGRIDIYGISAEVRSYFQEKGFGILTDLSDPSKLFKEVQENPCIVLTCHISHPAPNAMSNKVTLSFYNCYNQLVYKTKGSGSMGMDISGDYRIAVKKALKEFRYLKYHYNSNLTPKIIYPEVEQTYETEASLKSYYDNNTLSDLEGVYRSYQSETMPYYEIGIKRYGDIYKAIIIESEQNQWKAGEVKAVFEPSSMKGFFATKWYMGNKSELETFSIIENNVILSIEFEDPKTGSKSTSKFIKMYPTANSNANISSNGSVSSGSGFVVSTEGIIATNAHVIENSTRIEVTFASEIGDKTFDARVLLKDESNDVALIQIVSEEFKGFNNLPYSIINQSEIGEDVFTIGYPLNSLMGSNYKVTNGIISSNTGIKDDVRYMQITTPIQPGNSGGPLFNSDGNIIGLTTAKLNEKAVGTSIENVNYAIKATYLINIYNMLPDTEPISRNSTVKNKELKDQVRILKNYVCLIKVY